MTEQNTLLIAALQQKANEGDAQAQYELACRYAAEDTNAVEENRKLALEWLQKSAELGLVNAQLALGYFYTVNIMIDDDQNRAILVKNYFKYLKDRGVDYLQSPFNLSMHLFSSTNENADLCFNWFLQAAAQNNTEAYYWLACCYDQGIGTKQNHDKAFNEFKKAADQGMFEALERIAICYLEGKGIEKSYEHAYEYYEKAAEQGNVNAKEWLESQSRNFANINFDDEKFAQEDILIFWFTKAAELNIAEAQYRLALFYFEGKDVEKNYTTAKERLAVSDTTPEYAAAHQRWMLTDLSLPMEWLVEAATTNKHQAANRWFTDRSLSLVFPYLADNTEAENSYKFAVEWCKNEIAKRTDTAEVSFCLGIMYLQGKGVEQNYDLALKCFNVANDSFDGSYGEEIAHLALLYISLIKGVKGVIEENIRYRTLGHIFQECRIYPDRPFLPLLSIQILSRRNEYDLLKKFLSTYETTYGDYVTMSIKNAYVSLVDAIEQKDALHKALHDKEKEMLSFFTHTMRNALATAPESLRQAISLLGSEVYEKDTKHYQAINKIASLFSTLSLTDCLIDTFKQSISDPEEFKQSWQKDHTGEASPKWVIASALRQSLNRIIFMSDTSELRKLLGNPETVLIKATRKSFIEEVLPLNVDSQGVDVFYDWTLKHISAIEVSITDFDTLNFGVNQVRFSLLFAITSELILNALKYWDGENRIHISWQLAEQGNYVFSVKNHCKANATSNLAGTHKGLAFIKRLVELLGEQAQFVCKSEEQFFTAELILNKALFDGNV